MDSGSLIVETVSRYGWLFPAALAVISFFYIASASKDYRENQIPENKSKLNRARSLCIVWLVVTAILGAVSIWATPHLIAR
jgi:putative copper export protein